MKTVGIVGGIGPESTIEYYRAIIAECRSRNPAGAAAAGYPPILLNSIDLTRLVGLVAADDRDAIVEYLIRAIDRLVRAGADFAVLAASTPHVVFERVRVLSPIPMISLVEATCEAAVARGLRRVGLFGTRYTMKGRFFPDVFSRHGIEVVAPEPDEQDFIHERYMGELVHGIFLPETRARLLAIAGRLHERGQVEAIVLGGTELPLILRDVARSAVPFLDTGMIHVRRIVTEMLGPAGDGPGR
jgi:aspartate racemase